MCHTVGFHVEVGLMCSSTCPERTQKKRQNFLDPLLSSFGGLGLGLGVGVGVRVRARARVTARVKARVGVRVRIVHVCSGKHCCCVC